MARLVMVLVVVVGWCSLCVFGRGSDLFLSTAETAVLLESEERLLGFVHHCLTQTAAKSGQPYFTRLARELQTELNSLPSSQDARHPLDAYVGLRRFTHYWTKYITILSPVVARSVERSLAGSRLVYPDQEALRQTRLAIVRLQAAYHLNTSALTTSATVNITAADAARLAAEARVSGFPGVALGWARVADSLHSDPTHDFPSDVIADHKHASFDDDEAEETHLIHTKHAKFFSLCNHFRHNDDVTGLRSVRCEYRAGSSRLNRWKVEVLSSVPYVALYNDFVTDREAKVFVDNAMDKLSQALTDGDPNKFSLKAHRRLGKIAWLRGRQGDAVDRVTRRIQDVTGLRTTYRASASFGEDFQVVNYGIGGHYIPHYDYFKKKNAFSSAEAYLQNSGDRAATFMIYLGQVSQGGATVFPHLDLAVPPVQNAALFWHNFSPDGLPDPRTLHGGCPVIIGEKWVANKWIHEISTAMTGMCRTQPRTTIHI